MKKQRPEVFFTLVIFVIGTILLLITPAGANFDEETYVARIWEMGLGHFLPNSLLSESANFPNAFLKISYRRQINVPIINMDIIKEQLKVKIDWQDFEKHETRVGYFPSLFMIQAAVLRLLGAHFHFPVLLLYFILRFTYLVIYCLLIYLAIKVLPFGKWLVGTLALAPMCLIQAASISADPVVLGITFFFIAWILKLCCDPKEGITRREVLITCLLILAVGTLKTNMIFILVLLLIVPARKISKNKAWIAILVSVVLSVVIAFGWIFITAQVFNNSENDGIDATARLFSIFTNPLDFLKSVSITLSGRMLTFYKQAIGVSGYGYWLMPKSVYWLYPFAILLAFFNEDKAVNLSIKQRILFGLVGVFNIAMVFVIFYVVETPADYVGIWGVQGRYFNPFIPLLLIPFLFKLRFRLPPLITGSLVTLIAMAATLTLFLDYHAICGSTWFNQNVCSYPYYKNWDPSTFINIKMDKDTSIMQNLVVECNQLSQIKVWVNQYEPLKGQKEFFILETIEGNPLRTLWIQSEDIPSYGWLVIDLPPTLYQRNQELQFRILPNGKGGIPQLELARFPTNEYSRGGIQINKKNYEEDLVFQYTCLDGITNILK